MKRIFFIISIVLLIAFNACSSLNVNSDYDTEFDFSKFKTFKIVNKTAEKSESNKPNSIEFNRVSRAVDRELKLRGMKQSDAQSDCIVTFQTSVEKKLSVETKNYQRWQGYWVEERRITEYQDGLLTIDIINRATKNIVWRGWTRGIDANNTRTQEEVNEIVNKILSGYPPNG